MAVDRIKDIPSTNYYRGLLKTANITQSQFDKINSVLDNIDKNNKKATEREYTLLQALKTGNFKYSTKNENMKKEFINEAQRMQKLAGIPLNENLEQDVLDFWGLQQDDAAQSDGEYEAKWETEFFTSQHPEYKGREQEINSIVKKFKI